MHQPPAYTGAEVHRALAIGGLLGWLAYAGPIIVDNGPAMILWGAAIGLPVAVVSVWCVGLPILIRAAQHPMTWRRAAFWGSVVAIGIALVQTVIWRVISIVIWHGNNSSQIGGGHRVREIDGFLTAYGWWVLAQETLVFILLGAAIGLIVRAVMGPGRTAHQRPTQTSVE